MYKLIAILSLLIMPIYTAAAAVPDSIKSQWGYSNFDTNQGTPGDFILKGAIGETSNGVENGVWDCVNHDKVNQTASRAIVAVVARKIVEHGAYFCLTQAQCDSNNSKSKDNVWFSWYNPTGYSADKCFWLCDEGHAGLECAATSETRCDKKTKTTKPGTTGSSFGDDTSIKKNEKTKKKDCTKVSKVNSEIPYIDSRGWPGRVVVLGVTKFLEHGVMAAPIKLSCANRNHERAWFDGISLADGKARVLCVEGYKPSGDDCVAVNADACNNTSVQEKKWCDGFPPDKYNVDIHLLTTVTKVAQEAMSVDAGRSAATSALSSAAVDRCTKYFCRDKTQSFKSATDTTCTECVKGPLNGVDKNTGLCVTCKTGEYFNEANNRCMSATQYTHRNLMYGPSATKKEKATQECWTAFGDAYNNCVISGTDPSTSGGN